MVFKKKIKALVIGGGIHGLTSAIALANSGVEVTLVEKNRELMKGTSGATHNRAHMGYHYPRSVETAIECMEGLNFFKNKYPESLSYPEEVYYLVEKENSKISPDEFREFCDEMNIPYNIGMPESEICLKDSIDTGFRVSEPVFKLRSLTKLLETEAIELGIKILNNSRVIDFNEPDGIYGVVVQQGNDVSIISADIILNASYAYSNNLLKILGLEGDMTKYVLQKTEIPIVRSRKPLPSMTIMDGDFISIMQEGENMDLFLLYDVLYSVLEKEEGFYLDEERRYPSNFDKMIDHGAKYFPFLKDLEYVDSLWGSRPIPVGISGDSRKTRIRGHNKFPGVYSILEGKFISAPLVAKRLINQISNDGIFS